MMFQKIKLLFAVLLLAGLATQLAVAESFSQDDLAFAFGRAAFNDHSGEMVLLSGQEMADTEGRWFNWAGGGLIGGLGYTYGWYKGNYSWNNTRFAGSVGTGALIGGTFGAAGAAAGGGLSAGANIWRVNSFNVNYFGFNRIWRR